MWPVGAEERHGRSRRRSTSTTRGRQVLLQATVMTTRNLQVSFRSQVKRGAVQLLTLLFGVRDPEERKGGRRGRGSAGKVERSRVS